MPLSPWNRIQNAHTQHKLHKSYPQGKFDGAVDDLTKALRLEPHTVQYTDRLAQANMPPTVSQG